MDAKVKIKYADGSEQVQKYGSQSKYDKANTVQFKMKLNKKTDSDILASDILAWLEQQPSKQGAIKALIRQAINEVNK